MLKYIFKKIRSNKFSNRLVRVVLRKLSIFSEKATSRWSVYGSTEIEFDQVVFKAYSEGDDYVASALYYGNPVAESRDLACFLKFARRSNVILDLGANVGIYSVLSSMANKDAVVYSFEPNKVNTDRLKKNIDLNRLNNVKLVPKAVGADQRIIQFTVPASDMISDSSSALEDFSRSSYDGNLEWKTIEVEQITLDHFIREEGIHSVDLIKIDVEGYEMAVFEGASECIRRFHPVIQCEIFVDKDRKAFFDNFLKKNSYTAYMLLDEGLLRLDNGIQSQSGHNFIFINYVFPDLLTPVNKAVELLFTNQSIK